MITRYLFILIFMLWPVCGLFAQQAVHSTDERQEATELFIQGITEFENEEYEQALDYLTAAHLKLSDSPGVNYALSDVYLAIGDLSNAAYYGQIAADLEPENKWYHLKLADIYRADRRNEATIEAYEKALEYHPRDTDVLFRLAQTYVDFGQLLNANEVYDRILAQRGGDFDLYLRKFQNFNAMQMRDSALVQLEKMRELNPGNLSTLHTLSQYYLELDDEQEAREILEEARERNSRDPQTLILLAEMYIRNSEWENLGNSFTSMLADPLIYPSQKRELVRFMLRQYQQNPDAAVLEEQTRNVIKSFSESEPEYGPAQMIAADFFMQTNEPERALEKLEHVNRISPDDQDGWRQRVQVLFSMGEYDEVISVSDSAQTYAENDAWIQFFTGASLMLTERPNEAEAWLEKATLSPARREFRSIVYGTLGDVKHELDKWDEAVRSYERAIRLDSENHNAMNNYAYFQAERDKNLGKALELAEKAVGLQPENASYLDTLGWIFFKMENYEQAELYLQKSVDTGTASAEVFEHLGHLYETLGDLDNAKRWWRQALEKDPERTYLQEKI